MLTTSMLTTNIRNQSRLMYAGIRNMSVLLLSLQLLLLWFHFKCLCICKHLLEQMQKKEPKTESIYDPLFDDITMSFPRIFVLIFSLGFELNSVLIIPLLLLYAAHIMSEHTNRALYFLQTSSRWRIWCFETEKINHRNGYICSPASSEINKYWIFIFIITHISYADDFQYSYYCQRVIYCMCIITCYSNVNKI